MSGPVAAPPTATTVPLSSLRQGQSGIITHTRLDPDDAALLCAMGLCINATVKVIRPGQPCVVAVGGVNEGEACACGGTCRIGLARGLAGQILVIPQPAPPQQAARP
jgi:Fe2+ transport system protein FeoA